jgi:hypothetical protein
VITISIIHHHLEPGGVTKVVELAVQALSRYLRNLKEVRLVTGRSSGAETLAARLQELCGPEGVAVNLIVVDEIDYLPLDTNPGEETNLRVEATKKALLDACSGSIWMVHNYHLGKNPLFTRALIEIAGEYPEERICFYIHDFPECSRYGLPSRCRDAGIPGIPPE